MDGETDDRCIICSKICSEKEKRYISVNNYRQLGLTNEEYFLATNKRICASCRLLRGVPKSRKKCPIAHGNTPRKKLRLRELKLNGKEENKVAQKFQVSNKEKVCQACLYKIMKYVEDTKTDDTSKRECMNLNNARTQANECHNRQLRDWKKWE